MENDGGGGMHNKLWRRGCMENDGRGFDFVRVRVSEEVLLASLQDWMEDIPRCSYLQCHPDN